jgi:RNA polymerase sigma-70 factor (ECF subfamily)
LAEVIERAIEELPDKQRLALILFAIEGWPQRDVAEVLGCSLEAVKWNVFQARKTLKEKLAEKHRATEDDEEEDDEDED